MNLILLDYSDDYRFRYCVKSRVLDIYIYVYFNSNKLKDFIIEFDYIPCVVNDYKLLGWNKYYI